MTNTVTINGLDYIIQSKEANTPISSDLMNFAWEHWGTARNLKPSNFIRDFSATQVISLENYRKEIFGLCAFSIDPKQKIYNGKIDFVLVNKQHTHQGIGSFLTRSAVDYIKENTSEKIPTIAATLATQGGKQLMKRIRETYTDTVVFVFHEFQERL